MAQMKRHGAAGVARPKTTSRPAGMMRDRKEARRGLRGPTTKTHRTRPRLQMGPWACRKTPITRRQPLRSGQHDDVLSGRSLSSTHSKRHGVARSVTMFAAIAKIMTLALETERRLGQTAPNVHARQAVTEDGMEAMRKNRVCGAALRVRPARAYRSRDRLKVVRRRHLRAAAVLQESGIVAGRRSPWRGWMVLRCRRRTKGAPAN